jgi:hypothetical protein
MTEQKYISKGSDNVKKWHLEQECDAVQKTELEPVKGDELPHWARPCSRCANGVSADKIKQMVSQE